MYRGGYNTAELSWLFDFLVVHTFANRIDTLLIGSQLGCLVVAGRSVLDLLSILFTKAILPRLHQ